MGNVVLNLLDDIQSNEKLQASFYHFKVIENLCFSLLTLISNSICVQRYKRIL